MRERRLLFEKSSQPIFKIVRQGRHQALLVPEIKRPRVIPVQTKLNETLENIRHRLKWHLELHSKGLNKVVFV